MLFVITLNSIQRINVDAANKNFVNGPVVTNACTGLLKIKCPIGQNTISRQPMEIFLPKFQDLKSKDFPT